MPKTLWLLAFTLLLPFTAKTQKWDLAVMTFNIRLNNPDDGIYAWPLRKPIVAEMLNETKPDVIGCQEVLKDQLTDLTRLLKTYASVGVGREDGKEAGEFSPIFYNVLRFKLKDSGTFWLSETPEVPGSKSWNTACTRIVTWAKLKDSFSGKTLFFFNTHFDHMSVLARNESARLLLSAIQQIAGKHKVIVTGDFNDTRRSEMYDILTGSATAKPLMNTERISRNEPAGPDYTFIGFPFQPEPANTIDFIFCQNLSGIVVKSHQVITFNLNGKYPSDHLPVLTRFEILQTKK